MLIKLPSYYHRMVYLNLNHCQTFYRPKSRWPASIIIKCKKETDIAKVVELVVKMKTILAEKEYKESKEWLNKSINVLLKCEHTTIKLLIKSIWLDNPE